MRLFGSFPTGHAEFVHDIAYDYYGRRLATCSADQTIKIFDLVPSAGNGAGAGDAGEESGLVTGDASGAQWKLNQSWKAHSGAVCALAWSHPMFGQIVATASLDRTVTIWEEQQALEGNSTESGSEEREAAPSKGGRRSAVRRWVKRTSFNDAPSAMRDIAFAPHHAGFKLASASADGRVRIYEAMDVMDSAHWTISNGFVVPSGVASIAWCPAREERQPMIVVGTDAGEVLLWSYSDGTRKWEQVASLTGPSKGVNSVAWAPTMGRAYHLIASGSKDGLVCLWKVHTSGARVEFEQLGSFSDHGAEVWKVEWNITGTVLASTGDDRTVRLWKASMLGQWGALSVISGEN